MLPSEIMSAAVTSPGPCASMYIVLGPSLFIFSANPWIVRELSQRAGLARVPALYYVPSSVPNAFAVGRGDDTAIAVSHGLLQVLTGREVAAVLAHEVSHVRSGDTTVMSLSDTVGRAVQALSYIGVVSIFLTLPMMLGGNSELLLLSVVLILVPTLVTLLQLALSRTREFDADLEGATLIGDPEALDRKSTRLNSSHANISYAVFCLKK